MQIMVISIKQIQGWGFVVWLVVRLMKKKGKNYYTTYFVYYLIQGRTEDLRILGALAFSPRKARENFLSDPQMFVFLLERFGINLGR